MIKRHLTMTQRVALTAIHNGFGIRPLALRGFNIALATAQNLAREKLTVEDERGLYVITEAGRRALVEGLYEKQPQTINSGIKSVLAGMTVTVGPGGELVDPTYPSGRPL